MLEICQAALSTEILCCKRVKNATRIIYSCAIAHSLAAVHHLSASTLAKQFVTLLNQSSALQDRLDLPLPNAARSTLRIAATAAGMIVIEVDDWTIVTWLEAIVTAPVRLPACEFSPASLSPAVAFPVQHAHARCCSLLRSAHQTGLITLVPDTAATEWRLVEAIPWEASLADNRAIVGRLFGIWEEAITLKSAAIGRRLLVESGQVFQEFHAATPLWSQDSEVNRLAQIGMLLAMQRVLYLLLYRLQLVAPVAL